MPQLVGVVAEHVLGIGLEHPPGVLGEFGFELAGRPSRVSREDSDSPDVVRNVAVKVQHADVFEHHRESFARLRIGALAQHERGTRLDRSAPEHDLGVRGLVGPLRNRVDDGQLGRSIEHQTQRTFLTVFEHQQNRAMKVRIGQARRCHQQRSARRVPLHPGMLARDAT